MTARRKSDVADSPAEAAKDIQAVLELLGGGKGKAEVYRKETGKSRPTYLGAIGTDELRAEPHEAIKRNFGGGEYSIILRESNGDYVKGGSVQVDIAGLPMAPPDKFEELERKWEERIEKAKSNGTGSGEIMLLLFQQMTEQMRELRNPPAQAQQGNPIELAVSLAASMQQATAPLLEALLEKRNAPERDPMEMVQQVLAMAVQLKELGGDGGSGLDKVVGQLAAPLGRFFDSQADNAQHAIAAAATNPPPRGAPTLAPPKHAPAWYPLLRGALPRLLEWAKEGKDPELRADLVLEDLPDRYLGPIHDQLRRGPAFTAEFLATVPEAQDVREWFGHFFGRILEQLDAMSEDDELGQEGELEEAPELEEEKAIEVSSAAPADVDQEGTT